MSSLFEMTSKIDVFFAKYFAGHDNVVSIFVVGSMYDMTKYIPRTNNDYDIRILVKKVEKNFLREIEWAQNKLLEEMESEDYLVGVNNLVGLVNHRLSSDKNSLLIHLLVHEIDDLQNFLPLTHQYCYSHAYRIVTGKDYLAELQDKVYTAHYLIGSHEGIDYCCDMLERNVYKYFEWVVDEYGEVAFIYKECAMSDELICESVFYSLKNIFKNLYNISEDKKREIAESDYINNILELYWEDKGFIRAIYARDELFLRSLGKQVFPHTINLLKCLKNLICEGKV